MKKRILVLILLISSLFIGNVYAQANTNEIIGSTKYGDLLCSYTQTDTDYSPNKIARASIYYNADNGQWTVLYDSTLWDAPDGWEKSTVWKKTGTFAYVFSNKGDNVFIESAAKLRLQENHECPGYGGTKTSGRNRPCFGNAADEPECKMNKKHIFIYRRTYNYMDNLSEAERAEIGDSIDEFAQFDFFIGDGFCLDGGVKRALRIVGYIVMLARYLIPIIIIVTGSLDIFKSVMAGTIDSLKTQFRKFAIRIAIGVSVFFVPLVIHAILNITELLPLEYQYCEHCLLEPDDC